MGRIRVGLVFSVWAFVLLVAVFGVVMNVPLVKGSRTICIRADGSIDLLADAGTQTTVPIQLSISLSSFTISSGKSTPFTATLVDTNGNPLAKKTIIWNASAGSLSAINGTTNSYGQVTVTYTAPTVDVSTSVTITASFAGDAYYSSGSATSSGIITAAGLLQLEPVADAYIDRDSPDSNYGTATTLVWQYTGGLPPDRYRSYLKFDISSIPHPCYIISATLYLYTVTVPPVAYWTGDSFDVFSVFHDDWTENGITWNSAPPFIATIVDRPSGRIPSGAWISNDVTSFVRSEYDMGDTLVSFGIKVNGWDGTLTQANSREAATNQPYLEISIEMVFDVPWGEETYPVAVTSNSTITDFNFSQPLKQISFNVTGQAETTGFCNVTIPKSLLTGSPWTITINGSPITDFSHAENATHSFLHFTYTHASTLQIIITGTWVIPEFPSAMLLPLFMILLAIAIILAKKKTHKRQKSKPRFSHVIRFLF